MAKVLCWDGCDRWASPRGESLPWSQHVKINTWGKQVDTGRPQLDHAAVLMIFMLYPHPVDEIHEIPRSKVHQVASIYNYSNLFIG